MPNTKKAELLGMSSFGAASSMLRKSLMFSMAKRLDLCGCFRCGKTIETIDEFSIEHKDAWQSADDPAGAFFDLDNIAFSHSACNFRAAKRVKIHPSRLDARNAQFSRYYAANSEAILARRKVRRQQR